MAKMRIYINLFDTSQYIDVIDIKVGSKLYGDVIPEDIDFGLYSIQINGRPIDLKALKAHIIAPDDDIIMRRLYQGGGGLKDVLGMVAQLAVVAGAVMVGGIGALGAFAPLAGLGIAVAGSLAINALIAPPSPKVDYSKLKNDTPDRANSITGMNNQSNPYGAVAKVFGRAKVYPCFAAQPYTEIRGTEQYLNVLFCIGYKPVEISDLKIGETAISEYGDEVVIDADNPLSIYDKDVYQEDLSLTIFDNDEISTHVRTTVANTTKVSLDFFLPRGLKRTDTNGDNYGVALIFDIQYKKTSDPDSAYADLPLSYISSVNFKTLTVDGKQRYCVFDKALNPRYIGITSSELPPDTYDIRVSAYGAYDTRKGDNDTGEPYSESDLRKGVDWPINYDKDEDIMFITDMNWMTFKSFQNNAPVSDYALNTFKFVAMRIRASSRLSGVINTFNCIAQSLAPVYHSDTDEWIYEANNNPAWQYVDLLTHNSNKKSLAFDRIDIDGILAWADFCNRLGLEYNNVIDNKTTIWDVIKDITSAGIGSFHINNGKYSVIYDDYKTLPTQAFTPMNSFNFEGTRLIADIPDALRVKYNSNLTFSQTEYIIYNTGFDATTAQYIEDLELKGIMSQAQAIKLGLYYFKQMKFRAYTYKLNVDFEYLVSQRGDLVLLNHDVALYGTGFGRIVQIFTNEGGLITGIKVDNLSMFEYGKTYYCKIRLNNGDIVQYKLSNSLTGETDILYFETPIDNSSGLIERDELVLIGWTDGVAKPMIIKDIKPLSQVSAELTLVEYDERLYDFDDESMPIYIPDFNIIHYEDYTPAIPTIDSIDEDYIPVNVGTEKVVYTPAIAVHFTTGEGTAPTDFVEVSYFRVNSGDYTRYNRAKASDGVVYLQSFNMYEDEDYQIRIRGISSFETFSEWSAPQTYHFVGRYDLPTNVSNISHSIENNEVIIRWTDAQIYDLAGYHILLNGVEVASTRGNSYNLGKLVAGSYSVSIITEDIKGLTSAQSEAHQFTIDAPQVLSTSYHFEDNKLIFSISSFTRGSYDIKYATVHYGDTMLILNHINSNCTFTLTGASSTVVVKLYDVNDNYSTHNTSIVIPQLNAVRCKCLRQYLTANVIDNSVALTLTPPTNKLNGLDIGYHIYIGDELISDNDLVIKFYWSGTYTLTVKAYYIALPQYDGLPSDVEVTIDDSAIGELYTDEIYSRPLIAGATNGHLDYYGSILFNTNNTETFEEHFVNNSNSTLQDFIDDGYTIYATPTLSTGNYTQIFSFNTTIYKETPISVIINDSLIGNIQHSISISTSADGSTYSDTSIVNGLYLSDVNFKYVKVNVAYTSTDDKSYAILRSITVRVLIGDSSETGAVTIPQTYFKAPHFTGGSYVDIPFTSTSDILTISAFVKGNATLTIDDLCSISSSALVIGNKSLIPQNNSIYSIFDGGFHLIVVEIDKANGLGNIYVDNQRTTAYHFTDVDFVEKTAYNIRLSGEGYFHDLKIFEHTLTFDNERLTLYWNNGIQLDSAIYSFLLNGTWPTTATINGTIDFEYIGYFLRPQNKFLTISYIGLQCTSKGGVELIYNYNDTYLPSIIEVFGYNRQTGTLIEGESLRVNYELKGIEL